MDRIAHLTVARLGLRPVPLLLTFEVTHRCNLRCTYCDRHTPAPSEMTCSQIIDALAQFRRLGMRYISLDGGEPLLHPNIDEIVQWLVAHDVRVVMNSNGTLIPRRIAVVRQLAKVKISLDGPEEAHDRVRGRGSFAKALRGVWAARAAGVEVELTCVVARHNAERISELVNIATTYGCRVVFQPARNSLFLDSQRDGSTFLLEVGQLRRAFSQIEQLKRSTNAVANRWSSLRHFRHFPRDVDLPCAAGWIDATMDPEGNLFACGQLPRHDRSSNVLRLGVGPAFERLTRMGCPQCWCARVVESNYAWGLRVDRMIPPAVEPVEQTRLGVLREPGPGRGRNDRQPVRKGAQRSYR